MSPMFLVLVLLMLVADAEKNDPAYNTFKMKLIETGSGGARLIEIDGTVRPAIQVEQGLSYIFDQSDESNTHCDLRYSCDFVPIGFLLTILR